MLVIISSEQSYLIRRSLSAFLAEVNLFQGASGERDEKLGPGPTRGFD